MSPEAKSSGLFGIAGVVMAICCLAGPAIVGAAAGAAIGNLLRGHTPTGRRFDDVDEVYFFTFSGDRIAAVWGLEDTLDRFQQLRLDPSEP